MAGDFARAIRSVLILGLAPAVGLGVARFAYALVLPDMKASLGWSYAEAGFINTVNAAGYLVGALAGAAVVSRLGAFRTVMFGAVACVLTLIVSALTGNFLILSAARIVAGIGAAFTFIGGGAIAAITAQQHASKGAFLLALFYAGPGVGFVLAGIAVPSILERAGPGSWWLGWAALAVIAASLTALLPLARLPRATAVPPRERDHLRITAMLAFLAGYVAYGAGISAYLTFVVAWLAQTGQSTAVQSIVWTAVGVGAIAAPWLWQRIIATLSGGCATAVVIAATAIGAAVPLVVASTATLIVSAFVVGSACFTVVAATTAFVRRNMPQGLWPAGIAAMTSAFGAGQMIGPVVTGMVTDQFGLLSSGLWASAALLTAGVLLTAIQRDLAVTTEKGRSAL